MVLAETLNVAIQQQDQFGKRCLYRNAMLAAKEPKETVCVKWDAGMPAASRSNPPESERKNGECLNKYAS